MTDEEDFSQMSHDDDADKVGEDSDGASEEGQEVEPGEEGVELANGADGDADELFLDLEDSDGEVVELAEQAPEKDAPSASLAELEDAKKARAEVEEQLANTRDELESLRAERDDFKNRMMRTAADLENFRRRSHREQDELRKYGIDKVVSDLIPAVDNLERALQHAASIEDTSSIVDGVRMVYRQICSALNKYGVEGFESKGEMFDPQRHEAIQQVETSEHPTGTVMEQYQKGYFLHDRLLRPALVSVAKFIEIPDDEGVPEAQESEGLVQDEAQSETSDVESAETGQPDGADEDDGLVEDKLDDSDESEAGDDPVV